jgi:hypothetical protein
MKVNTIYTYESGNLINRDSLEMQELISRSVEELEQFFEISWTKSPPRLIIVSNRKDIDHIRSEATKDWLIGFVRHGDIYMLDPENYAEESCHTYRKDEFDATVKHEIVHLFVKELIGDAFLPVWMHEGIALYVAEQLKYKKRPDKFVSFLKYYDTCEGQVYREAGFVIEFLVSTYGKSKLLNLLNSVEGKDFEKFFKNVYGFGLEYENFKVVQVS